MTDLVVVSLESWDGVWRRNQHLVSRLLLKDPELRILFVEPPTDPWHDVRRGAGVHPGRGLRQGGLEGAAHRLWLFQPTKWLPRRLDPKADERLARAARRAARSIGMTEPLLWVNDPAASPLLTATSWPALYDITDDWLAADRSSREHARLKAHEEHLLGASRHVVVCSPRLLETKRASRVTLIPNAVDLEAYDQTTFRPSDLPTGPVALYLGTLHRDRLDIAACIAIAEAVRDEASFVLVGPIALDPDEESRLRSAGAVLLGPQEHTQVPAYLMHADVLVVPHVVTPFTDSLDPIKVYEYVAARRPIVSTAVAGFRELRMPHVVLTESVDLPREVLARLRGSSPEIPVSEVPTWDQRTDAMRSVLATLRPVVPHGEGAS